MKNQFTTFEICDILGIKRTRLQEWIIKNLVRPSIQKSTRIGEKNIFSLEDICKIEIFKCLIEKGFARNIASSIAFAPPDREVTKQLNMLVADLQRCADGIGKSHTLLSTPLPPMPVYVGFRLVEGEVRDIVFKKPEEFRGIYSYLKEDDIFVILNITTILKDVFEKATGLKLNTANIIKDVSRRLLG